ncbi:MAG: SusD/RagB family nutrient-binding outer membrane lipoprotein [Ginsengibacter sp.]
MKQFMKYFFQIKYTFLLTILSLLLLAEGCTKKFDELNTDPTTFSSLPAATIPKAFARSLWQGVYADPGNYEVIHSLYTDLWSQYFVDAGGFPGDRNVIDQNLIIFSWNLTYTVNWPSLKLVIDATETTAPPANAIAKIWKVYIFHQNTDFYGPIPYFQAGTGLLSIPYDNQQDIYNDFFKTLDSAVTTLKNADPSQHPFGTDDLIYHGDISKWIKFANTLRLRLALRISKVDAAKAKLEAEKAVADGTMTANDDNAFVDVGPNSVNGLAAEAPWENMRMSASMESYLKGFNDPRLQEYYDPAEADGKYHGLRNGLAPNQLSTAVKIGGQFNGAINLSNINTKRWYDNTQTTTPLNVMYAAESFFLRAEGALNGWNMGGSSKDLYEQGISTSLQQWGITDNTVIQNYLQSSAMPVAPNDYLNSPAVANIPIKFSANPAQQKEQILTQKWIALFPDGIEAWAELRRTGFPKLYPIVRSDNPDVIPGNIISRLTFQSYEYQTNGKAVQEAINLLGGPDKASTHVWWNK